MATHNFTNSNYELSMSAQFISVLSILYSLEKNSCSDGDITNFRDPAQTCAGFVHLISRLISLISRLMFSLVDLYLGIVDYCLQQRVGFSDFCQSSRPIIPYSRLVHIISRLIVD